MAESVRVSILTVSDRSSRGERPDISGPALYSEVLVKGWAVVKTGIVPDDQDAIAHILKDWADSGLVDLILTTGGTGFAPRDVTPEATLKIIDKLTPGLVEAIRQESLKITPHAMLSRAIAGIRGRTLIVNLPGSPKASLENLEIIAPVIPHAVALLQEDPASEAGHQAKMEQ
jgi:molybdenum cofactor synthesis domain-containing protein